MSIKFKFSLFLTFCFINLGLLSFGQSIKEQAVWYGYFFTIPLSQKWHNVTELQERHLVRPIQQNQFMVRTRFHRNLGKNLDASTGLSLFLHHKIGELENDDINWPEIRPHLDISLKTKLRKLTLDQRFRGEIRFFQNFDSNHTVLLDGFFFRAYRSRYRLQASILLAKPWGEKTLNLKLAEEIMGMIGGDYSQFTFDQNRISADLSLELSRNIQLELGYVYWHQTRNSGGFLDQHIFRTYLRHTLDFTKNKKKAEMPAF